MVLLLRPCLGLTGVILALLVTSSSPGQDSAPRPSSDSISVRIEPSILTSIRDRWKLGELQPTSVRPRLIVFFCEQDGPLGDRDPIEAPFYRRPQPIRSVPVDLRRLVAGAGETVIELGDDVQSVACVPDRISDLHGGFRLRAVLDLGTDRGHDTPGNPISSIIEVEYRRDRDDAAEIVINDVIDAEDPPGIENLVWVEIPSPMLSAALGRSVVHRAGVALPPAYFDPGADRRFWPVIYVIPGFGGDETDAMRWAGLLSDPAMSESLPQAIFIVLDPNDPLGHHGFVDGENVGPRGTALVEEFIPWLDRRFRTVSRPSARMLHGHSSGGWSSLWLQLEHPEIFGSCFSSAPDPVDFSAFGTVDLNRDENLFVDAEGNSRASMRTPLSADLDRVLMTIEEEAAMERAIAPGGTSGEQWSAWNAMFSGFDASTGRPTKGIDLQSGRIDRGIIDRQWSRYDILARLQREPEIVAPILVERVRLICGDRDCYYLDRAVMNLARALESACEDLDLAHGPGTIDVIPGATHDSIVGHAIRRWLPEMRSIAAEAPLR